MAFSKASPNLHLNSADFGQQAAFFPKGPVMKHQLYFWLCKWCYVEEVCVSLALSQATCVSYLEFCLETK